MEDEDSFKCKLCKNAYRYEGTLKTHVMVQHCKSNSYDCDQCEYHQSSIDVNSVKEQTYKDPTNKCNQCDYASFQAGHLREHLKTHSGEKSNKCNQKCIGKFIVEKRETKANSATLDPHRQAI